MNRWFTIPFVTAAALMVSSMEAIVSTAGQWQSSESDDIARKTTSEDIAKIYLHSEHCLFTAASQGDGPLVETLLQKDLNHFDTQKAYELMTAYSKVTRTRYDLKVDDTAEAYTQLINRISTTGYRSVAEVCDYLVDANDVPPRTDVALDLH